MGLQGRTDPQTFRACVPVMTHEELEPYIQRIADGDTSPILTSKPFTNLSLSSGTTKGKSKLIPFNEGVLFSAMQTLGTSLAYRNREFPIKSGRSLQFIYGSSKQFKTKGGIEVGTGTTKMLRNVGSLHGSSTMALQSPPCSPREVIFGLDYQQSTYCHLLCGLTHSTQVQFLSSVFAHTIVHALRMCEHVCEELCNDIREGVLSSRITDPAIRAAVSKLLKPDPEWADLIYKKFMGLKLKNWGGVVEEIWPNAKYVHAVMTGAMESYVKKLRHYAGSVPLVNGDYGATEGCIGANIKPKLEPELAVYAVVPDIGYFEFIPVKKQVGDEGLDKTLATALYTEAEPVELGEVKVGEEYEVLITNFSGLYRCRIGDVVKVRGFYNSTPELQFVCRRGLLLTINIDKNTEKDLQLTVEKAAKLLWQQSEKLELVDFTSLADLSSNPGHYIIFWELNGEATDGLLTDCCNCLDLSFEDAGYVTSRKVNMIGPLELQVVKNGTFQKILEHYQGSVGSVNQFKMPRCINSSNHAVLQILGANLAKSYFSTAYG